jgi:hypothetical protein
MTLETVARLDLADPLGVPVMMRSARRSATSVQKVPLRRGFLIAGRRYRHVTAS